jgi:hypothetical protein
MLLSECIAKPFLTSALDEYQWSGFRSDRFTPGEIAPDIHSVGVWVSPRAGLDAKENRKMLPLPEMESRPSNL